RDGNGGVTTVLRKFGGLIAVEERDLAPVASLLVVEPRHDEHDQNGVEDGEREGPQRAVEVEQLTSTEDDRDHGGDGEQSAADAQVDLAVSAGTPTGAPTRPGPCWSRHEGARLDPYVRRSRRFSAS